MFYWDKLLKLDDPKHTFTKICGIYIVRYSNIRLINIQQNLKTGGFPIKLTGYCKNTLSLNYLF